MANPHWQGLTNLLLVAGHSVYTADDFDRPADDANWYLQPFQKGEAPFYIEHIRKGVEFADGDDKSLLVFSGGQTRYEAGPRSEAQSYWIIANHFHWWWRTNVNLRATTEEYARDSFENLLFGICRFFECVGKVPEKVTVISWEFKRERFHLHRKAILLPKSRFLFKGVNNPVDLRAAKDSEEHNALGPFRDDMYGTGQKEYEYEKPGAKPDDKPIVVNLGKKRKDRNPMNRRAPYELSCLDCPGLLGLLQHPGPELYTGPLPWQGSRGPNKASQPAEHKQRRG